MMPQMLSKKLHTQLTSRLHSQTTWPLVKPNGVYGGLLQVYGIVNCTGRGISFKVFRTTFCFKRLFHALRVSPPVIQHSIGRYQGNLVGSFIKFDL